LFITSSGGFEVREFAYRAVVFGIGAVEDVWVFACTDAMVDDAAAFGRSQRSGFYALSVSAFSLRSDFTHFWDGLEVHARRVVRKIRTGPDGKSSSYR